LDNFQSGRAENLAGVRDRVALVHGSVLDPVLVDEVVAASDVVVHLAAAVGVRQIVEKPLASLMTNVRGSETIFESALRYGTKVLIASTSEIYGKNSRMPLSEDDDRVLGSSKTPRWSYSIGKAVDEILAFAYNGERGLPTIVVRPFNVVGPRQSAATGMVMPRLIDQAVRGLPLTVYGDGRQTRCFVHVSDAVTAMLALIDEPLAVGDVFNVGSTHEVTMVEVAERIRDIAGSSSEIKLIPYERVYEQTFEDVERRVPDTSKIRSLIGWTLTRSLDQIIEEMVASAVRDAVELRT
jgi:UDP-glucose 4-epimerase